MRPLVFYHANCWDGFCAAWVARKALGEIEAIPIQYGYKAKPAVDGRDVYVLDFSVSRVEILDAKRDARSLLVLDHHQTAEEALRGLDFCRFDMNKSGGRLAWEYFGFIGGWDGMAAPWLVDYTEDRDLWRHAMPDSEAVNAALRSHPLEFDLWDKFAECKPSDFAMDGYAIRRREQQIIDTHVRSAAEVIFDDHRIRVVNATVLFSEIAGELAKGRPFGACYFDRADGKRQWSLRSRDEGVDVAAIAKAHGGGGHRNAAGFEESSVNLLRLARVEQMAT